MGAVGDVSVGGCRGRIGRRGGGGFGVKVVEVLLVTVVTKGVVGVVAGGYFATAFDDLDAVDLFLQVDQGMVHVDDGIRGVVVTAIGGFLRGLGGWDGVV